LHPSFLLLMPWVLPKSNYVAYWIRFFLWKKIIIEGLDSLRLLYNFMQPFVKSHLPLQISVHLCLPMVKLPL
jgi:hypothetical protein